MSNSSSNGNGQGTAIHTVSQDLLSAPFDFSVLKSADHDAEDFHYSNGIQGSATDATSSSSPTSNGIASSERRWAIILFSLTTVLLYADQNLMAPNLTAIAVEFGFDDDERDTKLGGHIALAFWILGAPAALGVGILADHRNRSTLFALVVTVGEGACFLTYFTKTYWELYICRALTGFSVGGALPLIYSILGDLFPSHERHKVNAFVSFGTGAGISVGQSVAGFFGPTFGWRLPFLIVSVPALMCGALVFLTVKDPKRGGMEQAVLERQHGQSALACTGTEETNDSTNANGASQKELEMQQLKPVSSSPAEADEDDNKETPQVPPRTNLGLRRRSPSLERRRRKNHPMRDDQADDEKNNSLRVITSSGTLSDLYRKHMEPTLSAMKFLCQTPTVVLAMFQGAPGCLPWGIVNTYLNDFLAEDRGMSVEFATFTVLWFGAGNFFGLVVGGAGGHYLYQIDRRYPALLAGSMAILGCAPFWVLLNGVNNNSSTIFIGLVALVAGASAGVTGPIIKATLQNVTLPNMRGQAFALYNTFDDFGRGLGPVFLASLITSVGRTKAFNLGTLGWVICGILNLLIFFTAERDERKAQATLAASMGTIDALADDVLC
ncbi:Major Facilitator Superfamily [Seminavis robusta]|uniref:Major Facilitator Superfamily n=1 Tax=Seminavis robusta TaxID=568900 RepID=A0A9N8H4W9_9STRA|nr:Major Facilitator Superfamily [Seminavis robusta]|eukprot:Sro60_g034580.1 Major Facilitator Superfamily (609) ;mRNA; f:36484-38489